MSQQQTLSTVFDTCEPRDDVLRGELAEDQFAANLASVAFDPEEAAPVYRDATEFFASTYPTKGLQTLLNTITSRFLSTTGRDPEYSAGILCLDTTFGGGKTHDMIASHHLASNPSDIEDLSRHLEDESLATAYEESVADGLSPRAAVFVGGYVDARNARCDTNDPDAPNTNTMWGEIAYQLFGDEGYEYLKEYDRNRDSPGEKTLQGLFDLSDDPVLILIDEIAQYLEDASGIETGGTLSAHKR
jgi:Predicted ATPase (AAA+ superfamily)